MTITVNDNGSITVSRICEGYIDKCTYYGYTQKEAELAFRLARMKEDDETKQQYEQRLTQR